MTIDADEIISVEAVIYPTEDQCEALGGEIEKFKQFGVVRGEVQFTYEETLWQKGHQKSLQRI